MKPISRLFLLALGAVGMLAMANPALAYKETGRTGTTGPHSLFDGEFQSGAECVYKYDSNQDVNKLVHLYVNAPNVAAIPGMSNEKVAWTFTVQRRQAGIQTSYSAWTNRYTSPKYFATTDSSDNDYANFSRKGVSVKVPYPEAEGRAVQYRATVKFYWYGTNGTTVVGTATGRVEWYASQGLDPAKYCRDYWVG